MFFLVLYVHTLSYLLHNDGSANYILGMLPFGSEYEENLCGPKTKHTLLKISRLNGKQQGVLGLEPSYDSMLFHALKHTDLQTDMKLPIRSPL